MCTSFQVIIYKVLNPENRRRVTNLKLSKFVGKHCKKECHSCEELKLKYKIISAGQKCKHFNHNESHDFLRLIALLCDVYCYTNKSAITCSLHTQIRRF